MHADITPTIWSAAKQGNLEALQTLLTASPESVHQQASDGCTALHYAAFEGSVEVIELLLQSGSDANARSFAGNTPLHYAAFAGHVDAFHRLQAAGADIRAVDDMRTTVLHAAAAGGRSGIVELLLAEGLSADTPNVYGELPVHRAAQRNQLTIVQRLLDLGVDIQPADRYGMTVLHKAAIGGAVETTAWLLANGFDPSAGDLVGDTPIHSAASIGRPAIVAYLLDRSISPTARNHDQATPLHHAAIAGHGDIVRLLLERGADASAADALGRTPLHLAALRGHTDIVERLLQLNTLATASDINGHQPVDLAAFYGRTEAWTALAQGRCEDAARITPSAIRKLASQSVSQGEMMAWYLGHSGWAIRTKRHLFVIDYAPGEPEHDDGSLVNGRINPAEWGDVTVLVMTTHHHADHFDRRILDWDHPRLRRVYGWDAPSDLPGFRFTGQEAKTVGDVVIASIPATDAGSAFLIEADDVRFYHAGDHAARQTPCEPDFVEGIEWLADQFSPIQAAFLPVFGCGLPSPETLQAGNAFTIEKLAPDAALPMHIGWTSHFYRQFGRWARESDLHVGLGIADQPGDRFRIRNGTIEQVWT